MLLGRLEVQAESDDGPVCTGCGCDDASRLLMAAGEPTWLATALVVMFGMSDDDAREMVEMAWPDLVAYAYGRRTMLIRACASCADAASASFSDPVPVYSAARHTRGEYAQLHGLVQSRMASGLEDVLRDVLGSEPEDE
jgi:formate-dependent nitrite reductase cytochrome c552 subunit